MAQRTFDPNQPVPLALAPNDFDAQVIAHALKANDIHTTVTGAHAQMWLGAGNPLAPVSVMVRRSDRMNALRVLRNLRAEAANLPIDDEVPIRAVSEDGKCFVCSYDMSGLGHTLVCPECGTNLADESALFDARAGGSILTSPTLRLLIFLLLIACAAVAAFQWLK